MVSPVCRISFGGSSALEVDEMVSNPFTVTQDCFFAGPENALLPTLVKQTVKPFSDTHLFTPLVLWGSRGSGKSLLVHGLAKRCRTEGQEVHFINGKKTSFLELKKKYSFLKSDALWVVDDLDLVDCTESFIAFFSYLLDQAVSEGCRVIATMSTPPNELAPFPARLRSRLNGGLVLKLNHLSGESKSFVLGEISQYLNITLDKNAECLLNNYVMETDEDLHALINRIYQSTRIDGVCVIDSKIMGGLLGQGGHKVNPGLGDICRLTSKYFGISVRDLKGRRRQRGLVLPRHIFMYLAHEIFGHSLQKTGAFLSRDHSTVLHGCQVIQKKFLDELDIKKHILLLKTRLEKQVI